MAIITPRKIKQYGWQPDLPDYRDHLYSAVVRPIVLPKQIDLRTECPEVYDQGQLGSCTANAIGAIYEFVQKKETNSSFMPSRLFVYYNTREMDGTTSVDSGARLRDGMKTVSKIGVCPETEWPYIIKMFSKRPKLKCYSIATENKVIAYKRIPQVLNQMKACLAEGYPFIFGFTVFESFEGEEVRHSGIVELPREGERSLGGHAVTCVGYDDEKQAFLIRNSWGKDWGLDGHCWMPYSYVTNNSLSSDFWTIRQVTNTIVPYVKPKKSFWTRLKEFFFPVG